MMQNNYSIPYVTQRISAGKKMRVRFFLFFFIVFPFINIFEQLDSVSTFFEGLILSSYANYISILFASCVLLQQKRPKFDWLIVIISLILFFLLTINFFITPLASFKWLLNWVGFIYFSIVLVQVIVTFTQSDFLLLEYLSFKWLRVLFVFFAIVIAITWLANFSFFVEMLMDFQGDQINAILTYNIGAEKQSLGLLFSLFLIMSITFWKHEKKNVRILFLILFLIFLPSMIFIRTLYLALFLTFLWLFFSKSRLRVAVLFFLVPLCCWLVVLNLESLILIVEDSYDRLPSLRFAWYAMSQNLFGLGNGGYHIYVEQYQDQLLSMFGSESMIMANSFWAAPESDLVYFIASWGVFSVLFFIYFAIVLVKGTAIFNKPKEILGIEKVLLLMSFVIIFSGISQDNAGSLIWWIYMAGGSGVVLRHLRQSRSEIRSAQKYTLQLLEQPK